MNPYTLQRVAALIVLNTGVQEAAIEMQTTLRDDLEADVLELTSIILDVDAEFGVDIDDDAIEQMQTVGDLVAEIERQIAAGAKVEASHV
jgi:acyl carrier protein